MKYLILLISLLFFLDLNAQLTIGSTTVDTTVLASNLDTPWDLVYTPDSSLWFTERIGKVSRIDLNNGQRKLILDHQNQVEQVGESGLLGMEIILTTAIPKVYLVYTYRTPSNTLFERLARFDYDPNADSLLNEQIIIDSIPANTYHDGSRLEIANNYLFMTTGDAGNTALSQDLNSLAGKVLRLNLDGSMPTDNPISNSYIYSWGHRNPQGLHFANNILYSSEHGPSTDDEINLIQKGRNYGWPNVHGYCDLSQEMTFCNDSNVLEPIMAWTPTIATSGICYYEHPAIPEWQNSILLTTLKNQRIYKLQLNSMKNDIVSSTEHFNGTWGRLRDIETNIYGDIFLATNSGSNRIIKIYNPTFTGIRETSKQSNLKVFPSPANKVINLELPSSRNSAYLKLINVNGETVLKINLEENKQSIDISDLSEGLYFIEIKYPKGGTDLKKVLISK